MILRVPRRFWLPIGLGALIGALVLTLASPAAAQTPGDTPATSEATRDINATPTEEPTPGPDVKTVVKITVEQPNGKAIPKGDEFEAQVSVDQVEHMAGFQFTIGYDPKRVAPVLLSKSSSNATAEQGTPAGGAAVKVVKTASLGQFLTSSGRPASEVLCSDAIADGARVRVTCNLLGAPLCAGGQPGASGSGLLGSIVFKSKGGGVTTLTLKSALVLDDVTPPCPATEDDPFVIQAIPHRDQDATVELAKSSGSNGLLIVAIVVVAAVIVVGGGAGYLIYRRRQGGGTA